MAFSGQWNVIGIEHVISNGWIRNITAKYEGFDGNAKDRKIVFVEYADSGTPTYTFDDLTESDVLQMVDTYLGATEKANIEQYVEDRVNDLYTELNTPETAYNLPWES